jgi:S-(hydroxymethyl)glutathione dehydrogenase/alcohol dehydrogenase
VPIQDVSVDKPAEREVLVHTVASGVCHSDLHLVDGQAGRYQPPLILGHEGAGIVEAVGRDVTTVKAGDHVVGCLSGFCGACDSVSGPSLRGRLRQPSGVRASLHPDGTPLSQFGGVGSYAEEMLMHENSIVKIDPDIPMDRAALVGCGVLTGVGAALRTSGLQAGQTVAVFGCGGVGLSIIQGARIGGARQIIAVDQFDSS